MLFTTLNSLNSRKKVYYIYIYTLSIFKPAKVLMQHASSQDPHHDAGRASSEKIELNPHPHFRWRMWRMCEMMQNAKETKSKIKMPRNHTDMARPNWSTKCPAGYILNLQRFATEACLCLWGGRVRFCLQPVQRSDTEPQERKHRKTTRHKQGYKMLTNQMSKPAEI